MSCFITGTDTDVGKTIASSWMMLHLNANYWKPIQSGLDGSIDRETVQEITGFDESRFLPSTYELQQPLSPHEAAKRDGVSIDMSSLTIPQSDRPLVVEGTGGLMVPLNEKHLIIDLIKKLELPIVLVCRSTLGTINHTLLSIEAIKQRGLPIAGLIINGPKTHHNRKALEEYSNIPVITEIDWLKPLTKKALLSIQPEMNVSTLKRVA